MRVALATAAAARGRDDDEPVLLRALAARGIEACPVVWDDEAADWGGFALVVVRSTWDYPERHGEFLAWAERVEAATRLRNPAAVLRRNTDKRYLRRLEALGVPVVPTTWVPVGSAPAVPAADVVVKPVVSAGGRDTTRYGPGQHGEALAHVARLHGEGRTVMLQPYLPAVESGEVALVFIGGEYSHAVRRAVRLPGPGRAPDLFAPEALEPYTPTAARRAIADRALAALDDDPRRLLYARVDLVEARDGTDLLLEIELTEPSLYLAYGDGAAERFAAAIAAAARVDHVQDPLCPPATARTESPDASSGSDGP